VKNWWRKWSYEIPLALGDALWEVLVIVRLAAGKEHFLHLLHLAIRSARFAIHVVRIAIDRPVNGINKWRERRTPARRTKPRISDRSDDVDGFGAAWGAFATA